MIEQLTDWDKAKIYFQTRDVQPETHLDTLRNLNWGIDLKRNERKKYDTEEIQPQEVIYIQFTEPEQTGKLLRKVTLHDLTFPFTGIQVTADYYGSLYQVLLRVGMYVGRVLQKTHELDLPLTSMLINEEGLNFYGEIDHNFGTFKASLSLDLTGQGIISTDSIVAPYLTDLLKNH